MDQDLLKTATDIFHLDLQKRYAAGRKDREKEIIQAILAIKAQEFLSIANTGNEDLDLKYKIEADIIDRILSKIKGEENDGRL